VSVYRKVDTRMYADNKFRQLSKPQPNGQSLWTWLLTGPATCIVPGVIYNVGPRGMSELLKWDEKGFREAFQEVLALGMAEVDFDAPLIFIPKAIKYNPPQSPNVVTAWSGAWEQIPECVLKNKIRQVLGTFMEGLSEAFREAFDKACPKPMPNQEQEQLTGTGISKQEQESQNLSASAFADSGTDQPPAFVLNGEAKPIYELEAALVTIFEHYKAKTNRHSTTYTFTQKRKRLGMARLRECVTMGNGNLTIATNLMLLAVDRITESDWHMGRDPKTKGTRYCEWEKHLFVSTEKLQEWLDDNHIINQEKTGNGNSRSKAQQRQSADFDAIDEAVERRRSRQSISSPPEGGASYVPELAVNA
jgi:hypothetical protein